MFYYNGKNFCLRGGEEHRQLKISQRVRVYKPDGYIYHKYVSKNRMGTYKQLHIPGKKVPKYACPEAGDRYHIRLLQLYLEKIPAAAHEKGIFYLRPLEKKVNGFELSGPWYSAVVIKTICEKAGIAGNKTNHSLRATAATEMYTSDVPEKLIQ